jgi:hypothetical protein
MQSPPGQLAESLSDGVALPPPGAAGAPCPPDELFELDELFNPPPDPPDAHAGALLPTNPAVADSILHL